LCIKEYHWQKEKTIQRMGENICKSLSGKILVPKVNERTLTT
jgi:hypothetical protein